MGDEAAERGRQRSIGSGLARNVRAPRSARAGLCMFCMGRASHGAAAASGDGSSGPRHRRTAGLSCKRAGAPRALHCAEEVERTKDFHFKASHCAICGCALDRGTPHRHCVACGERRHPSRTCRINRARDLLGRPNNISGINKWCAAPPPPPALLDHTLIAFQINFIRIEPASISTFPRP